MEKQYLCLNNQTFRSGDFSIVPIRHEDKYKIMKWRNDQIFHLRQTKRLTSDKDTKLKLDTEVKRHQCI